MQRGCEDGQVEAIARIAPGAGGTYDWPLATDLGEAIGVNPRGAGLPSNSDHGRSDAMGHRARTSMSLRSERKPMDQQRLTVSPLLVAARASVGEWPEAIVDWPWGRGGGTGDRTLISPRGGE
jgi:hypothetical protein